MNKRELGNTGIYVTPVGFGVLTMGYTQLDLPLEEGAGLIRYAMEKGINFFDTAQYYETYPYIREAIADLPADERPVICSKCLGSTYQDMEEAVQEALTELDLDTIDIFMLHEQESYATLSGHREALDTLFELRERGVIRAHMMKGLATDEN